MNSKYPMKGNKFESRSNYQHHFMDDENKAESLSDLLNGSEVRGVRAAGPPGGPQGSGGAQHSLALPSLPCPAHGGCCSATASSAENSWLKEDNIKTWLVTATAVGRTPLCISFLGEKVSFSQPVNQPLTDENYPEWSLLEFAKLTT